jgi:Flp pilus assembly protein TadB
LDFLIAIFVFSAIFCLLAGTYAYSSRSVVGELLAGKETRISVFSFFRRMGNKVLNKAPGFFNTEKLDAILRLAGISLDAETYLGIAFSSLIGAFVLGITCWVSGVFGPQMVIILPLLVWGLPRYFIHRKADQNRAVMRISLIDFCSRLEQSVSGGIHHERVFQWAAEGDSPLTRELRFVVNARQYGKPLHKAFVEHFVDKLEIPEAEEIGVILTNADVRGVSPVESLRELNKEFRSRRQFDLLIKMSKLKPITTTVLTLTALVTCIIWLVAPLVLGIGKSFFYGF